MDLSYRKIIVTGGFGVLGRAVGQRLLAAGARVALLDAAPAAAAPPLPPGALPFAGVDLGIEDAAEEAVRRAVVALQGLDSVVNVAGGFAWETVADGSLATWDRLYAMNLRSAVATCRAALPHLHGPNGRIVNIGAMGATRAATGMGAYAASKSGVARLTEALAEELKDRGITVNAVLPSIIDTPANRRDMPAAEFDRWVKPESLAAIVAFLLSEDASAITGACLPVAGRV